MRRDGEPRQQQGRYKHRITHTHTCTDTGTGTEHRQTHEETDLVVEGLEVCEAVHEVEHGVLLHTRVSGSALHMLCPHLEVGAVEDAEGSQLRVLEDALDAADACVAHVKLHQRGNAGREGLRRAGEGSRGAGQMRMCNK